MSNEDDRQRHYEAVSQGNALRIARGIRMALERVAQEADRQPVSTTATMLLLLTKAQCENVRGAQLAFPRLRSVAAGAPPPPPAGQVGPVARPKIEVTYTMRQRPAQIESDGGKPADSAGVADAATGAAELPDASVSGDAAPTAPDDVRVLEPEVLTGDEIVPRDPPEQMPPDVIEMAIRAALGGDDDD